MKELDNFKKFLNEEEVNKEYSIEYRAYDHLKKLYALIEDSREQDGEEAALGIVDYAISYLKNIEYNIKTK